MSLDNNSANNFKDFLDAIKPFLNYQPVDLSCMGIDAFQFSTDEKPVGMWTDRKILYAKTIIKTGCSDGQTSVAHNIQNIDEICHVIAGVGNDELSTSGATSGTNRILFYVTKTNVDIMLAGGHSNETANITIFYTKTTDSPLSADEKFAGVTSGGEVIYEQDVTVNNFSCSQGAETQIADLSSASIDKMIYCFGTISESSWGSASIPELGIRLRYKDGKLYLKSDGSWSSSTVAVTIRYTKTP